MSNNNESKYFMVLKSAMNLPGVQIKRDDFLRKELSLYFDSFIVDLAIRENPARAGITTEQIDKIASACINYETNKVSAISVAAGVPGGLAMWGTVPADTAQYFAHIVRVLQKLIYLYGWPELFNANEDLTDETMNLMTLFIGVMFGVNTANTAITKMAEVAAKNLEKKLINKALTNGVIYPIVKKIAAAIGVKMTKEIFAKGVSKVVPILGGVVSGALTYATFKPSALRLKHHLETLPTADVNHYSGAKSPDPDIIDVN